MNKRTLMTAITVAGTSLLFALAPTPSQAAGPGRLEANAGTFKMKTIGGGGSVPQKGPVVEVVYDRDARRYTQVRTEKYYFPIAVSMACGGGGWKFGSFSSKVVTNGSEDLYMGTLAKGGGGWSGTTWADRYYAKPSVVDPIAQCNSELESLVAKGQHGKAQKGWAKKYFNAYRAEVRLSCRKPDTSRGIFKDPDQLRDYRDSVMYPVYVHCMPAAVFKTSGPSPSRIPVKKVGLQDLDIYVNPKAKANYKGSCPVKLNIGSKVNYLMLSKAKPVKLKYRYKRHDGETSPIYNVTLTKAGDKILKTWPTTVGANAPAAGTFAAPGGNPSKKKINGWVEIEVISAKTNKILGKEKVPFKVNCQPTRTNPPGGGGGVQPIQAILVAPGATSKPDLLILSANKTKDSASKLRVVIANKGKAASKPTRVKLFYHRSGRVMTKWARVPAIRAGSQARVVVDAGSPLAYANKLNLRVDDPSLNNESNEGNNSFNVQ